MTNLKCEVCGESKRIVIVKFYENNHVLEESILCGLHFAIKVFATHKLTKMTHPNIALTIEEGADLLIAGNLKNNDKLKELIKSHNKDFDKPKEEK